MASTAIANPDPAGKIERAAPVPSSAMHLTLAGCSIVLFGFCLIARRPGAMHAALPFIETTLLLIPPLLVPAALCHERKAWERRDAFLVLPWTLLIASLITQAAPTSATFAFPLRDSLWQGFDQHLGIRVPAMIAFTARHPLLQSVMSYSYAWGLHPLLLCAIFLPVLFAKRIAAQRFVLANAISFVLALPCMVFLPAVGPWVGWHFHPNSLQHACEITIYSLRKGSLSITDSFGGIICLPSFHVFWAVVSAHALQPFRLLRYPAIMVAILISVSTMTTGWHYGVDVLAGLLLAGTSTFLARMAISLAPPETNSLVTEVIPDSTMPS
jgi:PAP2 superfamily